MFQCCPVFRRVLLALVGCALAGAVILAVERTNSVAQTPTAKSLRHVVMFKFKASSSKEDVQKIVDGFRALPTKIAEIADFEYGTDNSPEGLADGFTHCFVVTFKSEKDRDAYLPHAAHKSFVEVLKSHLDKVLVIDFWSSK